MKLPAQNLLLIFITCCVINCTTGYKILVLSPFPGPSHWGMLQNVINGLLDHGHQVTTLASLPLKREGSRANYTEVLIDPVIDFRQFMSMEKLYETPDEPMFQKMYMVWNLGLVTSDYAWKHKNIQHFIHNDNTKFDIIISEQFVQESWLGFAHKYKAPIIAISTFGHAQYIDSYMGFRVPPSFVPHPYLEYTDTMTFYERFRNLLAFGIDHLTRQYYYLPEHQKQMTQYLGHLNTPEDPLPSVKELEKEISLVLVNSHEVLDARPSMPGVINIAGINLNRKSKPLPADIKQFLDEATHGVIYFSWGTVIKSANAPRDKIKHIIETFKGLKQRVLWKWEEDDFEGALPNNIMIKKWLPQNEILQHPNVVLFISHGGLFGSQEGLYAGVPMLYTPFFGDQHRNARRAYLGGYARSILFRDINNQNFKEELNELLTNKKYKEVAQHKGVIFRDNLNDPLEKAIYWIEFVARHKGAKHLKSNASNLNFIQYYSLDILAVMGLFLYLIITIFVVIISKICCNKSATKKSDTKKTK